MFYDVACIAELSFVCILEVAQMYQQSKLSNEWELLSNSNLYGHDFCLSWLKMNK